MDTYIFNELKIYEYNNDKKLFIDRKPKKFILKLSFISDICFPKKWILSFIFGILFIKERKLKPNIA